MPKQFSHIFLPENYYDTEDFTTHHRGGPTESPTQDRAVHSVWLRERWEAIWTKAREVEKTRTDVSKATKDGTYIEFEGNPGYELVTSSLDLRKSGIRLLNVYEVQDQTEPGKLITRATVFVPTGKQGIFLKKITEYAEQTTPKGFPKHNKLCTSVRDIRYATLKSMWRDDSNLIPQTDEAWCEIWLQVSDKNYQDIEARFRGIANHIGLEVKSNTLLFPERLVLLVKASYDNLNDLIEESPDLAEIRRAKETPRFFLELENKDQSDWAEDLRARLNITDTNVTVCVLDTGVNNGHLLLAPVLHDEDCHAIEPDWQTTDRKGHGTSMCGVAAFGDLVECLSTKASIIVNYRLESVKILPDRGENDPDLYGDLTIQAISRAEIQAPRRIRVGCMAVTSEDGRDRGRPTSWSAAIDKLSSGFNDDNRRLMIVSAGNVKDQDQWRKYPKSNASCSVHDPGQSWNALTVGSYTTKGFLSDEDLEDYRLLAQPNQLSPFSSTSCNWEGNKWPVKPEIVLEGGNLLQVPNGRIDIHDDLSVLSTSHQPQTRLFNTINATSASTALASRMAAQIQARYPEAWPETTRALLVHTADWPDELKRQVLPVNENGESNRSDYRKLLRCCGYGVPNLSRALECTANSLTMISEAQIQPYKKRDNSSTYATKDMHLYELPWPKDELLQLGEAPTTLRITLSYFIEPGPGERGWKNRYRYPSHGLRFDVIRSGETLDNFEKRINKAALAEEGEDIDRSSDSQRWTIGTQTRDVGSIHSDRWKGTAAQLATCNYIGVYPVIGWWKERHWLDRGEKKARYSLVVSVETPDEEVDIYTTVAVQIGIPSEIST